MTCQCMREPDPGLCDGACFGYQGSHCRCAEGCQNFVPTGIVPQEPQPGTKAAIAERVAGWRMASGLTMAELGERAGLDKSTVSRIESGKSSPSAEHVWQLAKALGLSIEALFTDSWSPPPLIVTDAMVDRAMRAHYFIDGERRNAMRRALETIAQAQRESEQS